MACLVRSQEHNLGMGNLLFFTVLVSMAHVVEYALSCLYAVQTGHHEVGKDMADVFLFVR